jgi:hypothetical protein
MKSLCHCIFFLLCMMNARGQGAFWCSVILNGQLIHAALSKPLYFQPEKSNNASLQPQVIYKFFHVKRLHAKVDLVWETTFECSNSGFEIQRKTSSGEWQKVAFVFSQATDGNSNGVLTYEYTDVNTGTGPSQYRLKQLDLDRSITYSEVRNIGGY